MFGARTYGRVWEEGQAEGSWAVVPQPVPLGALELR